MIRSRFFLIFIQEYQLIFLPEFLLVFLQQFLLEYKQKLSLGFLKSFLMEFIYEFDLETLQDLLLDSFLNLLKSVGFLTGFSSRISSGNPPWYFFLENFRSSIWECFSTSFWEPCRLQKLPQKLLLWAIFDISLEIFQEFLVQILWKLILCYRFFLGMIQEFLGESIIWSSFFESCRYSWWNFLNRIPRLILGRISFWNPFLIFLKELAQWFCFRSFCANAPAGPRRISQCFFQGFLPSFTRISIELIWKISKSFSRSSSKRIFKDFSIELSRFSRDFCKSFSRDSSRSISQNIFTMS